MVAIETGTVAGAVSVALLVLVSFREMAGLVANSLQIETLVFLLGSL